MHVVPTLACLGTQDDTVPDSVNRPEHLKRLCNAMGATAHAVLVDGANHEFESREGAIAAVMDQYIEAGYELPEPLNIEHVAVVV